MLNVFSLTDEQRTNAHNALQQAEQAAQWPNFLKDVVPRPIAKTGVIGGGTMGAGIAVAFLNSGLPVTMIERNDNEAERGRANVIRILDRDLERGRIDIQGHANRVKAFSVSSDYKQLTGADLIIEAVFEDVKVKREVFATLCDVCDDKTILATNTSYLNPEDIFAGFPSPDRFIGLHFFSPANIMKLLEIIPSQKTSLDVIAAGFALAQRCKKIAIRSGICEGFIGNRILKQMRMQAERVLLAGGTPDTVDSAMRAFGMKMGPFEAQDLSGLDIAAFQRKAATERGEKTFAPLADNIVMMGRLGRKTDAGWYDYVEGRKILICPDALNKAISLIRTEAKIIPRNWQEHEIAEAIIFSMLNEAAKILGEGIADQASDIDLVETYGYGFPRDRGGLIHFGRTIGFSYIAKRLEVMSLEGITELPCAELLRWVEIECALLV